MASTKAILLTYIVREIYIILVVNFFSLHVHVIRSMPSVTFGPKKTANGGALANVNKNKTLEFVHTFRTYLKINDRFIVPLLDVVLQFLAQIQVNLKAARIDSDS